MKFLIYTEPIYRSSSITRYSKILKYALELYRKSTSVYFEFFLGGARLPQSLYLFSEKLLTELGSCERGVTLKYARQVSMDPKRGLPDLGVSSGGV